MDLTPAQHAADAAVEDAIGLALGAYEVRDGNEMLIDWAVVAVVQDPEDDSHTGYVLHFPGGSRLPHVAAGMFRVAEASVLGGFCAGDE